MGNLPTSQKQMDPIISEFKGYMIQSLPLEVFSVSSDVTLEIRESTLPTTQFQESRNKGLFTTRDVPENTVVCDIKSVSLMMNDPMVDLREVYAAHTPSSLYLALVNLKKNYYSHDNAKERINTCMVSGQDREIYIRTTKFVPAGTELYRMYGFETWIFEIFGSLTNDNVNGFAQFVKELSLSEYACPYTSKIERLDKILDHLPETCPESESVADHITEVFYAHN